METVVITNYSGCLYAYPAEEWDRIEEKLASKVSSVNRKKNAFVRFFAGGAVEVSPDKQGRILIPPSLRSYAGLDKEVVILGMPNRFEIWDRQRWDVEVGRFEKEGFEDPELAREIDSLGI
jgi:MraZ protein